MSQNKVYFPVESLVGLGHFNRTGKLVREMISADMDVTVASGTFVDPQRFFNGAKQVEMPPYVFESNRGYYYKLDSRGERSIVAEFNEAAWVDQRTEKHANLVNKIKPDVFVSEFWPFNRDVLDHEMTSTLKLMSSVSPHALRIVSVRDVLDRVNEETATAEKLQKQAERDKWVVQTINENYDAILVHGDPRFVPLEETFPLTGEFNIPIVYTGYVIDDLPEREAPEPKDGTLLVSCGSGVDGHEMIYSFLTAWDNCLSAAKSGDTQIESIVDRPVHIICGPRFIEREYHHVVEWAKMLSETYGRDIVVERYRPDFTAVLAKAGFSLSLGGYNTTLETLALNVPGISIPKYTFVEETGRLRASTEQTFRLKRLQSQGMIRYVEPKDVQDSKKFTEILVTEMTEQLLNQRKPSRLDFNGAHKTIETIETLAAQKKTKPLTL